MTPCDVTFGRKRCFYGYLGTWGLPGGTVFARLGVPPGGRDNFFGMGVCDVTFGRNLGFRVFLARFHPPGRGIRGDPGLEVFSEVAGLCGTVREGGRGPCA